MIAISAAKAFAQTHDLKQVIIFGWDGFETHVVTYGDTIEACAQAAAGANKIKKNWGWPEEMQAEPARVKILTERAKCLAEDVTRLKRELQDLKNALWKACGDDEEVVKDYIESQRSGDV